MGTYEGLKWTTDDSGQLVMPELQADYLEWILADDKQPPKETDWCALNGVNISTARKWRQDRRFREQWERRAVEKNVSPDRLQKVVDVLYQSAVGTGDVAAAKQFLLHVQRLMPPQEIRRDASVSHMSDGELVAEVESILATGFGRGGGEGVLQVERLGDGPSPPESAGGLS